MRLLASIFIACEIALVALLPWHLTALLLLLYTLRWTNGYEAPTPATGTANWPTYRALWSSVFGKKEHPAWEARSKCIYLITPCSSPSILLRNVGFCIVDASHQQTHFTLPSHYFWIPLLRDHLLWCGALAAGEDNMLTVLQGGGNVCVALATHPITPDDLESAASTCQLPPQWLLEMAIREQILLCIVTVQRGQLDAGITITSSTYETSTQLAQVLADKIRRSAILSLGDATIKAQ